MNMPNNPSAFPLSADPSGIVNYGMSMRDYFAGQALAGFLAEGSQRTVDAACRQEPDFLDLGPSARADVVNKQIAWGCYAIADAMLAARNTQ